MTDLDQNALDAAKAQYHRTYTDPDGPLRAAITAYLAKRREQGYVLIYNPSVAAYDAVMERAEADTARSISEIVTTAIEEEREKVVRFMLEHSIATGHGDTIEDLLAELGGYLESLRSRSSQAEKG